MCSTKSVGVALNKMVDGENLIKVTAKDKDGNLLYANPFKLDKQKAIGKYGVCTINKNGLMGIWIPLIDVM